MSLGWGERRFIPLGDRASLSSPGWASSLPAHHAHLSLSGALWHPPAQEPGEGPAHGAGCLRADVSRAGRRQLPRAQPRCPRASIKGTGAPSGGALCRPQGLGLPGVRASPGPWVGSLSSGSSYERRNCLSGAHRPDPLVLAGALGLARQRRRAEWLQSGASWLFASNNNA